METIPSDREVSAILTEPDLQELIEYRQIQPEDYFIIISLSRFSKTELLSNFHNYFLNLRERSEEDLQLQIQQCDLKLASDPSDETTSRLKEMYQWYLEICRKYDWATANNINRVLERIDLIKYQ